MNNDLDIQCEVCTTVVPFMNIYAIGVKWDKLACLPCFEADWKKKAKR